MTGAAAADYGTGKACVGKGGVTGPESEEMVEPENESAGVGGEWNRFWYAKRTCFGRIPGIVVRVVCGDI